METTFYAHLSPPEQFDLLRKAALALMGDEERSYCLQNNVIPVDTINMINENIFYDIPFHYGFRITMNGRVSDLYKGIEIQPLLNRSGYYGVTVVRDGGNKSVTSHVHRLLALTFLTPHDRKQIGDLDINHIDGIKTNNHLSNLEWATRSQNCLHAYQTGLRSDNTPIRVQCASTGNEFVTYSIAEAGRFFGVSAGAIHHQLNAKKTKTPYKGYYLEYAEKVH